MKRLLALLLLPATGALAQSAAVPLPNANEAAVAYWEYEADVCRALIDICEGEVPPSPESVTELSCRAGRPGTATCRFRSGFSRCRARFVSAAAGAEYARALEWRTSPAGADHLWVVAWASSPDPRGPRIRCKWRPQAE